MRQTSTSCSSPTSEPGILAMVMESERWKSETCMGMRVTGLLQNRRLTSRHAMPFYTTTDSTREKSTLQQGRKNCVFIFSAPRNLLTGKGPIPNTLRSAFLFLFLCIHHSSSSHPLSLSLRAHPGKPQSRVDFIESKIRLWE